MGRLRDKLALADRAIAQVEHSAEQAVDEIVTRADEVRKHVDVVKTKKLIHLDGHMADLTEFARDVEDWAKNDRSQGGGNAYTGTGGKNDGG